MGSNCFASNEWIIRISNVQSKLRTRSVNAGVRSLWSGQRGAVMLSCNVGWDDAAL